MFRGSAGAEYVAGLAIVLVGLYAVAFFRDPARGQVPLGWAFNPNLADRAPQVLAYAYRHATTNDFFIAGDSGAGYLNARALTVRPDSRLPSGLEAWRAHCQRWYARWDMTITGFVLDGAAGVALAKALFDVAPQPEGKAAAVRAVPARAEQPGLVSLASAALRHDAAQYVKLVRHLPDVFRLLAGMVKSSGGGSGEGPSALRQNFSFGPKTPLNVAITAERGFACVSIPLAEAKAIAASQEAKLNDVVLALCSGALRRYLAHRGGIPKKPLIATMPISLRESGNTEFTTQATLSLVSLATHIADPLRRLRAIRDASGAMKSVARRAQSVIPTDFPSIGVPWLVGGLASLYGKTRLASAIPPIANLVISNVPGPPVTLHAAGLPMRAYWPLSIVEHGLGVNITVMSYAGSLDFGIVVARKAVPDPRKLAQALLEAHEELKQRVLPQPAPAAKRKRAVIKKTASSKS